jgi:hypothetical protein
MCSSKTILCLAACALVVGLHQPGAPKQEEADRNSSPLPHRYYELVPHRFASIRGADAKNPFLSIGGAATTSSFHLELYPSRVGKVGLRLDLKLWNLSATAKRVFPIQPLYYVPTFRDAKGKELLVQGPSADIDLKVLWGSDLTLLTPTNSLGGTYVLPDFYNTTAGQGPGIQVRVEARLFYHPNEDQGVVLKTTRFDVDSEWVAVPPP